MEKQRIAVGRKYCRRFLVLFFLLFASTNLFSQTLTLAQARLLRIEAEPNQNLYTKTDIKFSVLIPGIRPQQIQVVSADQKSDIFFRSLRKTESYDDDGTILEIWYSFDKKGKYNLSPLSITVQGRTRSIAFNPIEITEDPSKMKARIVFVFEDGTTVYTDEDNYTPPPLVFPAGKKIKFTVNLQYATQLVKFSWDIPKDSIFTQIKEYDFVEVKYRERNYTHDLIPVADFEWTKLKESEDYIPKFHIEAASFNGVRGTIYMPQIPINFTAAKVSNATTSDADIFEDAFYKEENSAADDSVSYFTEEDCSRLAELYRKERNSFFTYIKAKKNRINFEESCGIPTGTANIFPSILLYLSVIFILASFVLLIIMKIKKFNILSIIATILVIAGGVSLIYSSIKRAEQYGISKGGQIYSVPEENAASLSDIASGSKLRILEKSGDWVYIEFGETAGWSLADTIYEIK